MITSYTLTGSHNVDAAPVRVLTTLDPTKPETFRVTGEGLTPAHTKEIAVRVKSAMRASGFKMPSAGVTITIESDGAKLCASVLDLPIALAIMSAQERPLDLSGFLVAGELGLDGTVRRVRGAFQGALLASTLGLRAFVPGANARDAIDAIDAANVHTIAFLGDVYEELAAPTVKPAKVSRPRALPDFAEVRGQSDAIAACERAAIAHLTTPGASVLMLSGPPGTGKTMIARRIPSILPAMKRDEQTEVTRVYSAIGLAEGLITERPFRAPHHTISSAALVGNERAPGEVHLASHGILFLDEVVEFHMSALEALGYALGRMSPEARPMIVVAANPCGCGWAGSNVRECTCTRESVARYTARLNKAIAALTSKTGATVQHVDVAPVAMADLRALPCAPASAEIAARVADTTQTRSSVATSSR